jgi:hypothetical protein
MAQIGQLLKYVSMLNPQTSPVRLALYNFLNHFYRAEQKLNAGVFNTFFSHALEYPHWQQNRSNFGKEIQQLTENLMMNLEPAEAQLMKVAEIQWPHDMQIIEIENFIDFSESIHNFLSIEHSNGEKFRLISDQQKKLVAVVLFPDGNVRVRSFDKKMTIRNGVLGPLRKDLALNYTPNLELSEVVPHKLELGPYTCAQFEVIAGEVVGSAVRGYLFQKFQDFRGGSLRDHLKLFYSIKRYEQFYVNRGTDGFYLELTQSIERASNLLKLGSMEVSDEIPQILTQAETALEQVFVGDKLLSLLVRDLQNLWQNKKKSQTQNLSKSHQTHGHAFDSIN